MLQFIKKKINFNKILGGHHGGHGLSLPVVHINLGGVKALLSQPPIPIVKLPSKFIPNIPLPNIPIPVSFLSTSFSIILI